MDREPPDAVQTFVASDDSGDSDLHTAARRVLDGDTSLEAFETAARLVVAALSDEANHRMDLTTTERSTLERVLIRQDGVVRDPPVFHTLIANYHSGGSPDVLAHAGAELAPLLATMLAEGPPSKNLVLMLMLLREHLGDHVEQATVSAHHLAHVASFTYAELTLPYSCAFSEAYDRNREDIRTAMARPGAASLTRHLPLVHLLIFEWLTGLGGITEVGEVGSLATSSSRLGNTTVADAEAAARSLVIRHFSASQGLDDILSGSIADEKFRAACRSVQEEKAALASRPGPGAASASTHLLDRRRQAVYGVRNLVAQRASVRPRRRPRVALCVSGQLRGYQHAFETWRRTLLRSADCDIFVHTWSKIGRSSAEGFRTTLPFAGDAFTSTYRDVALRHAFEVRDRYPNLFQELGASDSVSAESLMAWYDTEHVVVEDDAAPPFDGWSNQQKMHSKIERAHELAVATGRDYDLVIRLRPDKPVNFTAFSWADVLKLCGSSPTILGDIQSGVHYAHLVIGDQFAMGSPASMSVYSRTWSLYPGLADARLLECPEEFSGHSSLAQVCWTHGIDVLRAPVKFGPLQEAAPMQSSEILRCLLLDAEGRMDESDRELLRAVRADLGQG